MLSSSIFCICNVNNFVCVSLFLINLFDSRIRQFHSYFFNNLLFISSFVLELSHKRGQSLYCVLYEGASVLNIQSVTLGFPFIFFSIYFSIYTFKLAIISLSVI